MPRAFSLAGFEVTLIGRFWVTTEATSAEDHEEALLLGCPPIGRLDESILCCHIQKEQEGLISPASKAEACRPSSVRREEAPLDGEDRSEIMCQKEMACWIPIWPAQPRILFPAISKEQTDCPHSAGHCDTPRQSLLRYSYTQIFSGASFARSIAAFVSHLFVDQTFK